MGSPWLQRVSRTKQQSRDDELRAATITFHCDTEMSDARASLSLFPTDMVVDTTTQVATTRHSTESLFRFGTAVRFSNYRVPVFITLNHSTLVVFDPVVCLVFYSIGTEWERVAFLSLTWRNWRDQGQSQSLFVWRRWLKSVGLTGRFLDLNTD